MARRYGYRPDQEPKEYICCSRCRSLLIRRVPMLLPPIYDCQSCGFRGERDDYDTYVDRDHSSERPLTGTP